jgi:Polyketide cyclase / dehydrase and lipid transport
VSERGWVSIENAIEISRPPEDVFDYLTDITKELEWNPRTRRVEKLTSGPIGPGTRFGAEWIKGNRNRRVRHVRSSNGLDIRRSFPTLGREGRGADLADQARPRVVITTDLRPKGLLALLLLVMRRTMRKREDQDLERVKAILEGR